MAFIPIDAKADLQGQKKGKITPTQHAILNAWCLASKTGILDFPQDHTEKGRCETDTLNITNIQQNKTEIIFNKGYLVICGRLVECEDGTKFTLKTPITGKETGRIIARFSLGASGNEEFKIMQKTGALIQNDLNDNPVNGEYELELYSYEAEPTSVTLTRTQPYVPDLGGRFNKFEASLKDEGKPLHGYDDAKGTIEERLTNLGFKKASIQVLNSDYIDAENTELYALGEVLYGKITIKKLKLNNVDASSFTIAKIQNWTAYDKNGNNIGTLPGNAFIPSKRLKHLFWLIRNDGTTTSKIECDVIVDANTADNNNLVIKFYHDDVGYASYSSEGEIPIYFVIDNFQNKVLNGVQE